MMAAVFHDAVSAARRSSFVKFDRFGPPKKAENKSMPKGPEAALRLRGAGCGQSKVASSDARSGPGGPPQPQPQMGSAVRRWPSPCRPSGAGASPSELSLSYYYYSS